MSIIFQAPTWEDILSKVLMRGLGSNAACAGADFLFVGMALSASSSTKSRAMKSFVEKFSSVNSGALGKTDRPFAAVDVDVDAFDAIAKSPSSPQSALCIRCGKYP